MPGSERARDHNRDAAAAGNQRRFRLPAAVRRPRLCRAPGFQAGAAWMNFCSVTERDEISPNGVSSKPCAKIIAEP